MIDNDIFEPYVKLIEIDLCGSRVCVPENNTILRCLQFLDMETVSEAELCWNGDCLDCQVRISTGENEKTVIACRTYAIEGMAIVGLSDDLKPRLS